MCLPNALVVSRSSGGGRQRAAPRRSRVLPERGPWGSQGVLDVSPSGFQQVPWRATENPWPGRASPGQARPRPRNTLNSP